MKNLAKKVRLLKDFFSNNLFPKRLSSIKQEKNKYFQFN